MSPANEDDTVKVTGELELRLIHADGSEEITRVENLVLNLGKEVIANRMLAAPTKAAMACIAVGTSNVVVGPGDIGLGAEVGRANLQSTTVVGPKITYIAQLLPGVGSGALVEAGVFNDPAPGAGIELARTTFPVINKGPTDTLQITWNVTVG
jgi:hypothetical protein